MSNDVLCRRRETLFRLFAFPKPVDHHGSRQTGLRPNSAGRKHTWFFRGREKLDAYRQFAGPESRFGKTGFRLRVRFGKSAPCRRVRNSLHRFVSPRTSTGECFQESVLRPRTRRLLPRLRAREKPTPQLSKAYGAVCLPAAPNAIRAILQAL